MAKLRQRLDYLPTDVGTYEAHIDYRSRPIPPSSVQKPSIRRGYLYTDREFPLEVATNEYRNLRWLRPKEFVFNPVFIASGTTRFDVGQRYVGTCWFLAILANISENKKLMERVMRCDDYSEREGVFHCKFWRFGQWHDVYIDDCLPVKHDNGELWCSRSATNSREMWVSLIEKAFARFHGSYEEVSGGYSSNAYLALTGGVSETILFEHQEIMPDRLFKRIQHAIDSGGLLACSVKFAYNGLIGQHAYSLNATEMVVLDNGQPVKLLRVRNPWGKTEWEGDWSDCSTLWHRINRQTASKIRRNKDDGEFWISVEDFMKRFYELTICSITPDVDEDGRTDNLRYITCLYDEWLGSTAAGSGDLKNNPKLYITIPSGTERYVPIVIQLIQDVRNQTDVTEIYFKLFQIKGSSTKLKDPNYKSTFSCERQIVHRYSLEPGRYIIVPFTNDAKIEKEFLIRVFSESRLEV